MEIGLLYLMQLNNKYLKSEDLSIQIFKNGLFFCTKKETYFFDLKKFNFDSNSLKNFIDENKIEFDFVELIVFDENSIIIPEDFFDLKKIEDIVSSSMIIKSDFLTYDKISETKQVVLYYLTIINIGLNKVKSIFVFSIFVIYQCDYKCLLVKMCEY